MKLIIYAGRTFKADFTVISDDGTTGEELSETDTATFSAQTSGPNPQSILKNISMNMIDASNGVFELTLTEAQTNLFQEYLGFQEDEYSSIGNHSGYLDFKLAKGNRQATVTLSVKEVL